MFKLLNNVNHGLNINCPVYHANQPWIWACSPWLYFKITLAKISKWTQWYEHSMLVDSTSAATWSGFNFWPITCLENPSRKKERRTQTSRCRTTRSASMWLKMPQSVTLPALILNWFMASGYQGTNFDIFDFDDGCLNSMQFYPI